MTETVDQARADENANVGVLLRQWRRRRRLSQLELATRAEVSGRHLSFVETGRSRPSPDMILRLAVQLEVPLRERDSLLLAGGYAPRYQESTPDVAAVMSAFRHLLDAHMPYPALLMDRCWDLVDTNDATAAILDTCAPDLLEPPINVVRLSLHPDGLAPRITNLAQWRTHILHQVDARARRTADARVAALLTECRAYPGGHGTAPTGPVAELRLRNTAGSQLRLFSVASEVVMPNDVSISELHLETFLPADEYTRAYLQGAG